MPVLAECRKIPKPWRGGRHSIAAAVARILAGHSEHAGSGRSGGKPPVVPSIFWRGRLLAQEARQKKMRQISYVKRPSRRMPPAAARVHDLCGGSSFESLPRPGITTLYSLNVCQARLPGTARTGIIPGGDCLPSAGLRLLRSEPPGGNRCFDRPPFAALI
jgi:hypothetical protein